MPIKHRSLGLALYFPCQEEEGTFVYVSFVDLTAGKRNMCLLSVVSRSLQFGGLLFALQLNYRKSVLYSNQRKHRIFGSKRLFLPQYVFGVRSLFIVRDLWVAIRRLISIEPPWRKANWA